MNKRRRGLHINETAFLKTDLKKDMCINIWIRF